MTELNKGDMRFARGEQGWYDRLQMWTGTEWQDITPGSASSLKHPITPPWDLVQQWSDEALTSPGAFEVKMKFATRAAQWGADQELEACLAEVSFFGSRALAERVRDKRRPEKLSIKDQALQALGRFSANAHTTGHEMTADFELLRQAVLQLPN